MFTSVNPNMAPSSSSKETSFAAILCIYNMASDDDLKLRIDMACNAAEQFTKLYFDSFDNKRHNMNKFYMANATLSWDGNPAIGKEAIQKFLEDLPETNHNLTALDAHPVAIETVKGQHTILVQVGGFIRFTKGKETRGFTQTFLITAEGNLWKIVTDCCRLQVPANKPRS